MAHYRFYVLNDDHGSTEYSEPRSADTGEAKPDLEVLDLIQPELSGIEVCRRLRALGPTRTMPIVMLTAHGEETDCIPGYDTGVDDHVVRNELLARLRAVVRRAAPSVDEVMTAGNISMDGGTHRVKRDARGIHLAPTEYRMLDHFMRHPGRVFSRQQLVDAVWGPDVQVEGRTVDVHVARLRKAINDGTERDPIRTVRSAGYSFDETFAS